MAPLNGSFVGMSFADGVSPTFISSSYDTLNIFGNGNFDKIWIRNTSDLSYFDTVLTIEDYQPTFDSDTVFLAEFDDTLTAGNGNLDGASLESWRVLKRPIGSQINYVVGDFPIGTSQAYDYRVQDGKSYIYDVLPKTATKLGRPLESEEIEADYYGVFLIDEDTGLVLNFDLNGSDGSMNAEDNTTIHKTFNKHNTISQGIRNTLSGTISGLVPEIATYGTDGWIQSADFVDTIQDFVNNQSSKLLKTRKGAIIKIRTFGFSKSILNENILEQPTRVSFQFQEIEDVDDY